MLFVIIGVGLGIWALITMVSDGWGFGEKVVFGILGLFVVGLGLVGGTLVAAAFGYFIPSHRVLDKRVELVALQDNIGLEGHFFLGTGQIDSKQKYFYYRKNGDAYKADSQNADGAIIYQDELTAPYLLTYNSEFNRSFWYAIGIPSKSQDSEFHIPKNSIKENFTLDLK